MRNFLRVLVLIAMLLIMAACQLPAGTTESTRIWIDSPLQNSQYTVGETINIVVHATDHSGGNVPAVRLTINGGEQITLQNQDGKELAAFTYSYVANTPGDYLMEAAIQAGTADGAPLAQTTFTVVGEADEAPQPEEPAPVEEAPGITSEPPTDVPPTDVPPTDVPPTVTPLPPSPTNTAVPPTLTNTPLPPTWTPSPAPDTERPVILQLLWSPTNPNQDTSVSFTVSASDNVGVSRIEIYFVRQGDNAGAPLHTCTNTTTCQFQKNSGFLWGTYSYYAVAFDAAGNQVSSFNQTVVINQVVQ